MHACFLCGFTAKSPKGLGQHVGKTHGVTREEYARAAFGEKKCRCGKHAKLLSICRGWDDWCSGCETARRSQSAKRYKALLKEDPSRYAKFCAKMSEVVKDQWRTQDQSGRIKNMTGGHHFVVHSGDVDKVLVGYQSPWPEGYLDEVFA